MGKSIHFKIDGDKEAIDKEMISKFGRSFNVIEDGEALFLISNGTTFEKLKV